MKTNNLDEIILAYALKDKKHTMEVINSVDVKYFEEHQWVFSAIKAHFTDPKFNEIPTAQVIGEKLKNDGFSAEDLGKFIKTFAGIELLAQELNSSEFSWNLNKLRIRFNNKLQKTCADTISKTLEMDMDESLKIEKVNKIIKETTTHIDSIYKKQVYREGSIDESAKDRFKKYEFIEQNPNAARGILTGFREFDRITNGLHAGEFMIVAGETGTGKSVIMHNIGINAYLGNNNPLNPSKINNESGHNILYFSLEMPKESIERRLDACMADIYYNQLRDGTLSAEDKKKYFNSLKFQMNFKKKFHVVDMPQNVTTRDIELKYLEICETIFKPDLIIIDYMGIMSPNNPGDSDWLSLGQISKELHEFARVYDVPVLTGSQVNRAKEGFSGKQEYSTNRIARSGMTTTNANIIVQLGCRDDEYLRTDIPVYIVKMRDGEKGSFTLSKNFAKMKVSDLMDESFSEEAVDDSV